MKLILTAFVLFFAVQAFAQVFPAPGYNDRTAALITDYEKTKGLELSAEKEIEGIQVKLFLSKSSKDAIAKGAFLIPDPEYSQDKLNAFILETFESSLAYLKLINPNQEVTALNLILVDRGGDVGTISEVPQHSRLIELHLVRWHKYSLRNSKSYVAVSSIHEFGHVINYMYSPKEVKLHREMTGVLVECLNLIQLYGIDAFNKSYLKNFTSKINDLTQIRSDVYNNMNVIRNIAAILFKNVYSGIYKAAENDDRKLTENFVMNYLKNPLDDKAGFDDALLNAGILDSEGKALTFTQLREDTIKDLTPVVEPVKVTPVVEPVKEVTPVVEPVKEVTPIPEPVKEITPVGEPVIVDAVKHPVPDVAL